VNTIGGIAIVHGLHAPRLYFIQPFPSGKEARDTREMTGLPLDALGVYLPAVADNCPASSG
jgi:hypothetical protein